MDDATVIAKVKSELSWLQKHERMILVILGGLVLWFAIGKIDQVIINHDAANLSQAKVTADAQAKANATLAAQVVQDAADRKALEDKLAAQNDKLEQATITLANALAQRQKTDATLPPDQLVARWNTLVPTAGATVTSNGVTLPSVGAIATVQQLEQVPVLSSQLSNTQQELKNAQSLVSAEGQSIALLNTEVSGLRAQITDNQKVCTAQIAVIKAQAAKSKRRWFYAGVIVGFIGRQLIKTETGF